VAPGVPAARAAAALAVAAGPPESAGVSGCQPVIRSAAAGPRYQRTFCAGTRSRHPRDATASWSATRSKATAVPRTESRQGASQATRPATAMRHVPGEQSGAAQVQSTDAAQPAGRA